MSTSATPSSPPTPSAPVPFTPLAPPHAGEAPGQDLDLEEDVAPNLGGEDQMQDA
jgi:hypothetical protein